jgi:hypothetical protein
MAGKRNIFEIYIPKFMDVRCNTLMIDIRQFPLEKGLIGKSYFNALWNLLLNFCQAVFTSDEYLVYILRKMHGVVKNGS